MDIAKIDDSIKKSYISMQALKCDTEQIRLNEVNNQQKLYVILSCGIVTRYMQLLKTPIKKSFFDTTTTCPVYVEKADLARRYSKVLKYLSGDGKLAFDIQISPTYKSHPSTFVYCPTCKDFCPPVNKPDGVWICSICFSTYSLVENAYQVSGGWDNKY